VTDEEILGAPPPPNSVVYRRGDTVCVGTPVSNGRWEVHGAVAPHERGKTGLDSMRWALAEFWKDHPDATELLAGPKADNRAVRVTNALLGFSLVGKAMVPWPDGVTRETCVYRMSRPCAA